MKFEEAFKAYKEGKSIYRKSWDSSTASVSYSEHSSNYYVRTFSPSDIEADDWQVLEKPGKTFDQIFEDFKNGKSVRRTRWSNSSSSISRGLDRYLDTMDVLSDDWEIVE